MVPDAASWDAIADKYWTGVLLTSYTLGKFLIHIVYECYYCEVSWTISPEYSYYATVIRLSHKYRHLKEYSKFDIHKIK